MSAGFFREESTEPTMNDCAHPGSFRDPSGFLFFHEGQLYRKIHRNYGPTYETLMRSGLYEKLTETQRLLIPHEEVELPELADEEFNITLKPQMVPFISYPYEWCFSMLKDAALATLAIQRKALEHGMSLKDCSAYNIQFLEGKPLLIDTLSLDAYQEGAPWVAYRQFCQHFLAPLSLMSLSDPRLGQLFRSYIDGIPLDLAARLLPWHARLNLGVLLHIVFHARGQTYFSQRSKSKVLKKRSLSKRGLLVLVENLESTIERLQWNGTRSPWTSYYEEDSYSRDGFSHKHALVSEYLDLLGPKLVWDFGGNSGVFSAIAESKRMNVILFDSDATVVERAYQKTRVQELSRILPLQMNFSNPSPSLGWAHEERMSLANRGPADCVVALAFAHHLAISGNVPLSAIARFFATVGKSVIVEFVPKNDPKVQLLLSTREDIFPNYAVPAFEQAFLNFFSIVRKNHIHDSHRILYAMKRKA